MWISTGAVNHKKEEENKLKKLIFYILGKVLV